MSADTDYWTELKQLLRWFMTPGLLPLVQIVQACPARSGSSGSSRLIAARLGLFASPCSFGLIRACLGHSGSSGLVRLVQARPARPAFLGLSGLVRARPGSVGLVRARLGQGWWALGQALPPKDCPILKFEERFLITITTTTTITSQQSYLERGATAYPRSKSHFTLYKGYRSVTFVLLCTYVQLIQLKSQKCR